MPASLVAIARGESAGSGFGPGPGSGLAGPLGPRTYLVAASATGGLAPGPRPPAGVPRGLVERFSEVMRRAAALVPEVMREGFAALLAPESLAAVAAVLALWAGSHAFGVGFAVDLLLAVSGATMLGLAVFEAASHLKSAITRTVTAEDAGDLDAAAWHLAQLVAMVGVEAFAGIVTRGGSRIARQNRAARRAGDAAEEAGDAAGRGGGPARADAPARGAGEAPTGAGRQGAVAGARTAARVPPVVSLDPREVRFSQRTAGGRGRAEALRASMGARGWDGPPVDAVRTRAGIVSIDNTRVAVAQELGLPRIPVRVWEPSDLLPDAAIERFGQSRTWGEALAYRTGRQNPPLDAAVGTAERPRMPGGRR